MLQAGKQAGGKVIRNRQRYKIKQEMCIKLKIAKDKISEHNERDKRDQTKRGGNTRGTRQNYDTYREVFVLLTNHHFHFSYFSSQSNNLKKTA